MVLDTLTEAIVITKLIQIIDWKEFAATALKSTKKAFVVYMSSSNTTKSIYLAQEPRLLYQKTIITLD